MVYKGTLFGLIVQIVPKFVEIRLWNVPKNVRQDVGALMGILESLEIVIPASKRKIA